MKWSVPINSMYRRAFFIMVPANVLWLPGDACRLKSIMLTHSQMISWKEKARRGAHDFILRHRSTITPNMNKF